MATEPTVKFGIPEGWSISDLRQFLESELQEDFGGSEPYSIWVRDIYDEYVVYSDKDGTLQKRSYAIMDSDVTWGDASEVVQRTTYQPTTDNANMSAEIEVSFSEVATKDDVVYRKGLIFRAGAYPDKDFSLTPDELKAAAVSFKPVEADLEHKKTILDGKLGQLVSVTATPDGSALHGTFAEPKWLADLLQEKTRKVSLTWDKAAKSIVGIAHTLNPRINDAAVFAAYSTFTQETPMATEAAAVAAPEPTVFEKIVAFFQGAKPEELDKVQSALTTAKTGKTPREIELEQQLATFQAAAQTSKEQSVAQRAEIAVKALIDDLRIKPADTETATALFTVALRYDERPADVVYFSADSPLATVKATDALNALYKTRPQHNRTTEQTSDLNSEQVALFEQTETTVADPATGKPVSAARKNQLLGLTPLGQAAKEEKN